MPAISSSSLAQIGSTIAPSASAIACTAFALFYHAVNVLILAEALERARGPALLQMRLERLEELHIPTQLFVRLGSLAGALQAALQMLDIRQDQLKVDGFNVACGIDRAFDVDDILIVKATDDVDDRIHLADVGQELVAQPLALARAAHQSRDIHKLHHRRGGLFRVVQVGQRLQALVRHGHHADVGVDGAERVVRALRARLRDCIEQSRFPDIRKPDDTEFHDCHSSN